MIPPARPFARRAALAALVLGLGSAFGCTVFDGLTVPPPDVGAPPPHYLTLERGVIACSLVFRCPLLAQAIARSIGVPASDVSFSSCMSWLSGPLSPTRFGLDVQTDMLACVASATGCSEAMACASVEPLAADDPRCAGAPFDQCPASDLLADCAGGFAMRCFSPHFGPGSECRLGIAGKGACALSGCSPDTAGPPRCTSGVFVQCDPTTNLRVAQSCTAVGLQCPEGAEGAEAQCATADGIFPCDDPGKTECSPDGERARVCDGASKSEFDCKALGGHCVIEDGRARCDAPGSTCSPTEPWVDRCAGSTISLCVGGRAESFDCAAVGLSCRPAENGRSGHCG
jgi:hypothetical protein